VHADGGGVLSATVTLDREAAQAVPDLGVQLQLADLRQAGWVVTGPSQVAGGGFSVEAAKPFASPAEAMADASELSGPAGPVRNLVVRRHASLLSVSTAVSLDADLSARLEAFADDAFRARLGGHALGVDEAALAAQAGKPVDQLVSFRVEVRAPGAVPRAVDVPLGATRRLAVASTVRRVRLALEAGAAVVASVIALVLAWARRRADRAHWTIGGGKGRRDRWSVRR
ncbi:MAG TPA: hypothetical protein VF954_04200, partial [Acidimicrobiales bacterium]